MILRAFVLICSLLAATAANACTPGDMVVFTREEDSSIFNLDQVAQTSEGLVYRGLFEGQTAYLSTSSSMNHLPIGSSGYHPPRSDLAWESDLGFYEDGQFIAEVVTGPLQGRWQVTCQATN